MLNLEACSISGDIHLRTIYNLNIFNFHIFGRNQCCSVIKNLFERFCQADNDLPPFIRFLMFPCTMFDQFSWIWSLSYYFIFLFSLASFIMPPNPIFPWICWSWEIHNLNKERREADSCKELQNLFNQV